MDGEQRISLKKKPFFFKSKPIFFVLTIPLLEIFLEKSDIPIIEIWDCEICCNPNQIHYQTNGSEMIIIEVTNGNE